MNVPTTDAIARAVGADPDRLEEYLEALGSPSPQAVVGVGDRDEPAVDRDTLAIFLRAWLLDEHQRRINRGLRPMKAAEFKTGDVVVDRDADPEERNAAVVVNTPPIRARDWKVFDGVTVAQYEGNQRYDDKAPVVLVVFREDLAEWRPDYQGREAIPATSLEGAPVNYYTFPEPRLALVERADENTAGPLHAIADALAERQLEDVTIDRGAEVVRVEKLGIEYVVEPDGSVGKDDRIGDKLEEIAHGAVRDTEEVTAE